jgi:hypothetical protein
VVGLGQLRHLAGGALDHVHRGPGERHQREQLADDALQLGAWIVGEAASQRLAERRRDGRGAQQVPDLPERGLERRRGQRQ